MNAILSKVVWSYGERGAEISAGVAVAGTVLTGLLGGWDKLLQALLILMIIDYVSGVLAALKNKCLDSKVMFWGGVNKVLVLCVVAAATELDMALALPEPRIRAAAVWFYIAREGLSLLENYGKISGEKAPRFLAALLEQLKEKGDGGEDRGDEAKRD